MNYEDVKKKYGSDAAKRQSDIKLMRAAVERAQWNRDVAHEEWNRCKEISSRIITAENSAATFHAREELLIAERRLDEARLKLAKVEADGIDNVVDDFMNVK